MNEADGNSSIKMPLIPLLISYLGGLVFSWHIYSPLKIIFILSVIFTLILSWSVLKHWKRTATSLSLIIFFLFGSLLMNISLYPHLPSHHISRFATDEKLDIEGRLYLPLEVYPPKARIYLEAERIYLNREVIPVSGRILISVRKLQDRFSYGDRIRMLARLRHPRNFGNPGGFDYERYLGMRKIWVTGHIENSKGIVKISSGNGNPFFLLIEKIKEKIRTLIEKKGGPSSRGILKALILGERGDIPQKLKEDYIVSGAAHILAISGLHIGIVAFIFLFFIRRFLLLSERLTLFFNINKISAFITIFPVIFYTFIAGMRISTLRAAIMIIVYLMAIIIEREREIYNALALAAFIILIIFPGSLFDTSFQLSFISVLAILYLTPRFLDFKEKEDLPYQPPPFFERLSYRACLFTLVSLSAIIGTGPLVAYYFNRISPLGVFTNLFVVPAFGFLIVPLGLFSGLTLFFCPSVAGIIMKLDSALIDIINSLIHIFASFPAMSFRTATPTLLEIVLFYLLVMTLANLKRNRWAKYGSFIIFLLIIGDYSYHYVARNYISPLKVTFLSVGQGESTLAELPGGKVMLIDGGGFYDESFDVGKLVVAPLLWKRKIKKVDYLVLTHPHVDHLGGLPFILRNFDVSEVWSNKDTSDSKVYRDFISIIREKRIKRVFKSQGSPSLIVNGVRIDFLHPLRFKASQWEDLNNSSLVIKLTLGRISFLFTGDIEREAETVIIRSEDNLKSTVIKVPHHGSMTSSTAGFLKKVKPGFAVFSVGYHNGLGFPHGKIIRRYEKFGCKIYRTDRDGAVMMTTDGADLKIKTFGKTTTEFARLKK